MLLWSDAPNESLGSSEISRWVKPVLGQPVTCLGTFYVGEIRDQGFLAGIYRMDALEAHLKE